MNLTEGAETCYWSLKADAEVMSSITLSSSKQSIGGVIRVWHMVTWLLVSGYYYGVRGTHQVSTSVTMSFRSCLLRMGIHMTIIMFRGPVHIGNSFITAWFPVLVNSPNTPTVKSKKTTHTQITTWFKVKRVREMGTDWGNTNFHPDVTPPSLSFLTQTKQNVISFHLERGRWKL